MKFIAPIPRRFCCANTPAGPFRCRGWYCYWVLGVTAPGTAVEALELDPEGRPEHFFQSGWRIVYRRYVSVQDIMLPERLDLERQGLEARLVVGRWNFEA